MIRIIGTITMVLVGVLFASITLKTCGVVNGWTSDVAKTVHNEFDPSVLLKKYEGFKDISAAIDQKRAEIEMYQSEIKLMESDIKSMDRDDKTFYQQRKSELIGVISVHNQLCADYNSAMSKFNYRFTNKGDLPATNLEPLPREYKPYINNLNGK